MRGAGQVYFGHYELKGGKYARVDIADHDSGYGGNTWWLRPERAVIPGESGSIIGAYRENDQR